MELVSGKCVMGLRGQLTVNSTQYQSSATKTAATWRIQDEYIDIKYLNYSAVLPDVELAITTTAEVPTAKFTIT